MRDVITGNLKVVENKASTSYLTNDTVQHFVLVEENGSLSKKTLCGVSWKPWRSKPQDHISGWLCERCERIAEKKGWYRYE